MSYRFGIRLVPVVFSSPVKHNNMRTIMGTFFVLSSVFAQAQNNGTLYLSKSLSADAINTVEASTSGGSIEVSGGSSSDAHIEVYAKGNNNNNYSKEEIQKKIDQDYDFSLNVSANKLTVTARTKRNFINWNSELTISYRIFVSTACATRLSTSGGNISMANLTGSEHFNTSGGNLDVKGLSGKIEGRTSGGGIQVTDTKDDIDLQTSGGGIEASRCSGKIYLNTSGGSIELTELSGEIRAMTSGGNVNAQKISGELITHTSGGNISMSTMSGSLEASTSGGNINVDMIETGKYVKLHNSGGNVHLGIPKGQGLTLDIHGDQIKTDGLKNFSGSIEKQSINGTVNGGGIPIDIHAGSGGVTLALN
jgi:hypothetical protein